MEHIFATIRTKRKLITKRTGNCHVRKPQKQGAEQEKKVNACINWTLILQGGTSKRGPKSMLSNHFCYFAKISPTKSSFLHEKCQKIKKKFAGFSTVK